MATVNPADVGSRTEHQAVDPSRQTKPELHPDSLSIANVAHAPALPREELCSHCRLLSPQRSRVDFADIISTDYERQDSYPEFPELEASAAAGCHLCSFLRNSLRSVLNARAREKDANVTHPFWDAKTGEDLLLKLEWDRKVTLRVQFLFNSFQGPDLTQSNHEPGPGSQHGGMVTSMRLISKPASGTIKHEGEQWGVSVLDFLSYDSVDLHANDFDERRRLPLAETLSTDNLQLMQRWIKDCETNHPDCRPTAEHWVPFRLIEIDGQGESRVIRLIETSKAHVQQGSQFAALSHMWGDMTVSPPLRTFLSNYDELKARIEEAELPKNFREAIDVCSALGVRYLWIDSLCIIQNSREDWEAQACLMHLVYRNALLTIVATSATSTHDGFLQRDVEKSRAIKFTYAPATEAGAPDAESNYMILGLHDSLDQGQRMHAIDQSRWNTRGWTMQERSLSTRSIHFCHNKLFFECRRSLKSEENEPPQEVDMSSRIMWPRGRSVTPNELYQHWELLQGEYCQRKLTNGSDKLPAIQSVAAEMEAVTKWTYIPFAGMWEQHLQRELLWVVWAGSASSPSHYRAPSWSWASLNAHVFFVDDLLHGTHRTVPEALTNCFQRHPFKVKKLYTKTPQKPGDLAPGCVDVESLSLSVAAAELLEEPGRWRKFFPYNFVDEGGKIFAHGRLDLDDSLTGEPLVYVHVSQTSRATGLILQLDELSSGSSQQEQWMRVGVATLFDDKEGHPLLEEVFAKDNLSRLLTLI